jgi:hypothetical protein
VGGDRWSVSERWSIAAAALYGALVGPPLQVVQNAIADDGRHTAALSEHPEYLFLGLIAGAALFVVAALVRNRVVLKKDG